MRSFSLKKAAVCLILLVPLFFFQCGKNGFPADPDGDYRRTVAPVPAGLPRYDIRIKLSEDLATFTGNMDLKYTNDTAFALDRIMFRLYPNLLGGTLSVEKAEINGVTAGMETGSNTDGVTDYSVLALLLPVPVEPGKAVQMSLAFRGSIASGNEGYGFIQYRDNVLLLAYFYPLLAPVDDEGWHLDPPAYPGDPVAGPPAWYRVEADIPEGFKVAASGVKMKEKSRGGDSSVFFEAGPARDFFLAVSDSWGYTESVADGIRLRSWYPAAAEVQGKAALSVMESALQVFSDTLGTYPYRELETVSGPTNALGVEYPGVVVINDDLYEGGASSSGIPNSALLEATIVHEVAHQWFYNLVGNNQAREPWIDEGIAQYLTLYYFRKARGKTAAEGYERSFYERWDRISRKDIPLNLPVSDFTGKEYSAIIYGRAPLFLLELEKIMGEGRFSRFLRDLVRDYAWNTLDTAGFLMAASRDADRDLTELFFAWFVS